jgi:hypothetical protein
MGLATTLSLMSAYRQFQRWPIKGIVPVQHDGSCHEKSREESHRLQLKTVVFFCLLAP